MSALDEQRARDALTFRLRDWGVADPQAKARQFITELVAQGWQMSPDREPRRRPPKRDADCPTHPGEWADGCRACAADQLAGDQSTPARPATDSTAWITACRDALRRTADD